MLLDEKIVAIEDALTRAGIRHAFGGALALGYFAAPRATHDIDLNLFVAAAEADAALAPLAALGIAIDAPHVRSRIEQDGQVRVFWEHTPIDLFFSYDALHDRCAERRREVDFGGRSVHILSPEDLIVFKVLFDRAKDWRDIAEMIFASGDDFDYDYVREWIARILPEDDARRGRLETLVESGGKRLGEAEA